MISYQSIIFKPLKRNWNNSVTTNYVKPLQVGFIAIPTLGFFAIESNHLYGCILFKRLSFSTKPKKWVSVTGFWFQSPRQFIFFRSQIRVAWSKLFYGTSNLDIMLWGGALEVIFHENDHKSSNYCHYGKQLKKGRKIIIKKGLI